MTVILSPEKLTTNFSVGINCIFILFHREGGNTKSEKNLQGELKSFTNNINRYKIAKITNNSSGNWQILF